MMTMFGQSLASVSLLFGFTLIIGLLVDQIQCIDPDFIKEIEARRRCHPCPPWQTSELGNQCTKSKLGKYRHAAISTDSALCARTGK